MLILCVVIGFDNLCAFTHYLGCNYLTLFCIFMFSNCNFNVPICDVYTIKVIHIPIHIHHKSIRFSCKQHIINNCCLFENWSWIKRDNHNLFFYNRISLNSNQIITIRTIINIFWAIFLADLKIFGFWTPILIILRL